MNKIEALGHIGVGGQKGWVFSANGISPTVPASTWKDPIKFIDITKKEKKMSNSEEQKEIMQDILLSAIPKSSLERLENQFGINDNRPSERPRYRIRKLTPIECWKLMGWQKSDVLKARDVAVSDSQLYKQAGNGIVTNCVQLLMEHLYKAQYDNNYKCTDENFIQPQPE